MLSTAVITLAATFMPAASGAMTAPTPVNTSAPILTGAPVPGQTLTCSTGAWSNNPSGFAYAWLRDGSSISGQAASTYIVQSADQGHSISCRVTATNAGGEYTIVGLPSGSYKVSFAPGGSENVADYLLQYFNNQSSWSAANPVSVTAPNATGGINAAMHLGGEIAGTVTAAVGGQPLAGITVCASLGEAFGGCATTNAAGEYSIVGLTSGTYTVSFVNNSFFGEGGDYVSQSQGGIVVTAPNKTAGVNAQLQPGGHITGTVTNALHVAVQGVVVCAFGESFSCAVTDGSGKYTLVGLNGSYRVAFIPGSEASFGGTSNGNYILQYYNGRSSLTEAEAVSVTAPNVVSNINAELQPGGQISGIVSDAVSHVGVGGVEVCAFASNGSGCASSSSTGEYTISGLQTGSYTVDFTPPEGSGYAPQALSGISVTAPIKTMNVNAAMQVGGRIAGAVTDASTHAPLANVRVCASDESVAKCASTDAAGGYTISGLSTNPSYTVIFAPPEGANYVPQSRTGVAVTAPNTSNVDATMQPGAQIVGRVTDASSGAGLANISVCATEVGEGLGGGCAITNGPGGSASASSNVVSVPAPNSTFTLAKKPVFNPKTGNLEFVFVVPNAGTFKWSLFFRNSDVGFTASLGTSLGEEGAVAETAKKKGKAKRCKAGFVKHKGKCVRLKVPFGSGSKSVPAGTVKILVHASAKALKALKAGRTLHVSGPFTFQSALGGSPVTHTESAVARMPKKKGKKHHKK